MTTNFVELTISKKSVYSDDGTKLYDLDNQTIWLNLDNVASIESHPGGGSMVNTIDNMRAPIYVMEDPQNILAAVAVAVINVVNP